MRRVAALRSALLAIASTAIAACADAPTSTSGVVPGAPPGGPAAAGPAGGYRLTVRDLDSDTPAATIVAGAPAAAAVGTRDAAPGAAVAQAAPARGLTPRPSGSYPMEFQLVATGAYSYGTRATPGAFRYVYIMFRVRNASATTLQNLVFLGNSSGATLGGTAISALTLPGDVIPAPSTAVALAQSMTPAGAAVPGPSGAVTALWPDVLQIFPEADLAAAPFAGPYTPLPYGFTVLDTLTRGRTIAPSGSGSFPNIVLFGFRVPRQATASQDVQTFAFDFYAVTDAETRVTQSLEELDPAAAAAASARASALGATALHVFRGSTLASLPIARVFCGVRTGGTRTSPTAVVGTSCASDYAGISVTPSPLTLARGATQQLTATLTPAGGASPPTQIAYASANPAVATVSATGLVTAVAPGTATIYVGPYGGSLLTTVTVTVPAPPAPLRFASVWPASGSYRDPSYTCGLTTEGKVYCWGTNEFGQFGNGPDWPGSASSLTPVLAVGGMTFTAIETGDFHACGLTAAQKVWCWGRYMEGRLGVPGFTPPGTPVQINSTNSYKLVSVGPNRSCAAAVDGTPFCWGYDVFGTPPSPTQVGNGGLIFMALATGAFHSCGLDAAGVAYCWNNNAHGELGDGTTTPRSAPTPVATPLRFAAITAGGGPTYGTNFIPEAGFSCGLTGQGEAYCWGSGGYLGDGTTEQRLVPTPVATGLRFASLSAGAYHTCGLTSDGTAYCWGRNQEGQLGTGATSTSLVLAPVAVSTTLKFASINPGAYHTCAVATTGIAYCWGDNKTGQLGDGTTTRRTTPVQVAGQ